MVEYFKINLTSNPEDIPVAFKVNKSGELKLYSETQEYLERYGIKIEGKKVIFIPSKYKKISIPEEEAKKIKSLSLDVVLNEIWSEIHQITWN